MPIESKNPEDITPAPPGFQFDAELVELATMRAFREVDADMMREVEEGRIAWAATTTDANVPVIQIIDKGTGAVLGVLAVRWQDVGYIEGPAERLD